jgi:hypothetical protein
MAKKSKSPKPSPKAKKSETPQADMKIWNDAVEAGKEIVARLDQDQMRLGELADQVACKYGDRTLAKYAKAIGVAECTLKRRRTTYRAWKAKGAAPPRLYSVAQELAAHPEGPEIVADNPNITAREARQRMREWKPEVKAKQTAEDQLEHEVRRGFKQLAAKAEEMLKLVDVDGYIAPKLRELMIKNIEPNLLEALRGAGTLLIQYADRLERLEQEQDEEWDDEQRDEDRRDERRDGELTDGEVVQVEQRQQHADDQAVVA